VDNINSNAYKEFHKKLYKEHGNNIKSLDWSEESQWKRFEVLASIGKWNNKTVLDVGCGFGDFLSCLYTQEGLFQPKNYVGIDVMNEFVEAAKKKYPFGEFRNTDIIDINDNFDYVIASGIFYLPSNDWVERTSNILQKMFNLCNIGIGANFLSALSPNQKDGRYYADPSYVLVNTMNFISKKVILRHDYLPNDFTVFVYK